MEEISALPATMKTKPTSNAKARVFEAPVTPSEVLPEDASMDNGSSSTIRDQEGTAGMSPQMGGHGKASHNNTTSFGPVAPEHAAISGKAAGGQEEGGRPRQPNTSSAGRVK